MENDEEKRTFEARLEIQKQLSENPGEDVKFNYKLTMDVDPNMTID